MERWSWTRGACAVMVTGTLLLGCSLRSLVAEGRPCDESLVCGPGTTCHLATHRCVASLDAAADRTGETWPLDLAGRDLLADRRLPDLVADRGTDRQRDLKTCPAPCPLGCNGALGRCNRLRPSGFEVASFYDQVSASLTAKTMQVDTDTGEIRDGTQVIRTAGVQGGLSGGVYWGVVPQVDAPEISVFGVLSLSVPAGATITVKGTRALALYARAPLTLSGLISVPAVGSTAGPGGRPGGPMDGADGATCAGGQGRGGKSAGSGTGQVDSGGGGGGHGSTGGKGGDTVAANAPLIVGGQGGAAIGSAAAVPLAGGCGGGAGGGPDLGRPAKPGHGGYGGGGGGAVQIACDGKITVALGGIITAPGAGGEGGHYGGGGGGGGAGGAILLEAPSIEIAGTLAANGGGGGAGAKDLFTLDAPSGEPGKSGPTNAAGAPDNPQFGGRGGYGGALSIESGGAGGDAGNGGGGGGAAGRIRLNAPVLAKPGVISPTPNLSSTVGVW